MKMDTPLVLIILDGFGIRDNNENNAIALADKPHWEALWQKYPHVLLEASGPAVGLPNGQMGNSEVGHLTIGAGRVVHQDLTRIDNAIVDGSFFKNTVLVNAFAKATKNNRALHILGLLSEGGVHSHEQHIIHLVKLAKEHHLEKIYFHIFTDGRDVPPISAKASIMRLQKEMDALAVGKIVSIIGRFYAMDRDNRYERVKKAYELITEGVADYYAKTPLEALENAYARGETDEFIKATAIKEENQTSISIEKNDVVLFMNFRADRARELTNALINPSFNGFKRQKTLSIFFITLTEYDKKFTTPVVFKAATLKNMLGDYLSRLGLRQLRIAETEKYAHVTFFFNGGIETPLVNERRILIPSPKVATYDLKPEMSLPAVTDELTKAIYAKQYDFIVCNFANADMVGHTGDLFSSIKAINAIDLALGQITKALQKTNTECMITADHGNAEIMYDKITNQPHTAHTTELVPFIYIGRPAIAIKSYGTLSDVAPSILNLLKIPIPSDMTGIPLFTLI